jgi:hypothetical protein
VQLVDEQHRDAGTSGLVCDARPTRRPEQEPSVGTKVYISDNGLRQNLVSRAPCAGSIAYYRGLRDETMHLFCCIEAEPCQPVAEWRTCPQSARRLAA